MGEKLNSIEVGEVEADACLLGTLVKKVLR